MPRPTQIAIDPLALLHNLRVIQSKAPQSQIVAMVKADAYGCGVRNIVPTLEGMVAKFGVATIEEGLLIRQLGSRTPCVIFQGVYHPSEWNHPQFEYVIHQPRQLQWLIETPLSEPVKIWLKVNTGMNRLGFLPQEIPGVIKALKACSWVDPAFILMTHFANADEPDHPLNQHQQDLFFKMDPAVNPAIKSSGRDIGKRQTSLCNSAAIFQFPKAHQDWVRPGLSLYGVSPFSDLTHVDLGLKPVMQFTSEIIQIFTIQPGESVGYGSTWQAQRKTKIGVIAVGYGDGYPRHVAANTPIYLNGYEAPIVGRISMDTLTVDLTDLPTSEIGMPVELWGRRLAIERVAKAAGTIPYELLTQVKRRA